MGVMLQNGGVYPMLGPRQVLDLFAAYYPDPLRHRGPARPGRRCAPWPPPRGAISPVASSNGSRWPWPSSGGPQVAFLDEPTAGVDPEGRLAIRAVVADLRAQGVCVLLTTHELAEAEKMADRIVILSPGPDRPRGHAAAS